MNISRSGCALLLFASVFVLDGLHKVGASNIFSVALLDGKNVSFCCSDTLSHLILNIHSTPFCTS